MAVNDISFRQCAAIEFPVKENNSAADIYDRLNQLYGEACTGASSVKRWVKYFKDRSTDITNQPHFGWPRSNMIECNEQKVHTLKVRTEG